jgi:hypothetical protein
MDTYAFIKKILGLHDIWDFDAIYVDAAANQNYFSKWALREAKLDEVSLPLFPVTNSHLGNKGKDQRIMACSPRWARGDCFIVEGCVGSQRLVHAMVNYPAIGQDDLLDAMAQLEVMEGRGRKPKAPGAPAGSFDHIRSLTRDRPQQAIGNWWNDRSKRRIYLVRSKYGQ